MKIKLQFRIYLFIRLINDLKNILNNLLHLFSNCYDIINGRLLTINYKIYLTYINTISADHFL